MTLTAYSTYRRHNPPSKPMKMYHETSLRSTLLLVDIVAVVGSVGFGVIIILAAANVSMGPLNALSGMPYVAGIVFIGFGTVVGGADILTMVFNITRKSQRNSQRTPPPETIEVSEKDEKSSEDMSGKKADQGTSSAASEKKEDVKTNSTTTEKETEATSSTTTEKEAEATNTAALENKTEVLTTKGMRKRIKLAYALEEGDEKNKACQAIIIDMFKIGHANGLKKGHKAAFKLYRNSVDHYIQAKEKLKKEEIKKIRKEIGPLLAKDYSEAVKWQRKNDTLELDSIINVFFPTGALRVKFGFR